MTDHPEGRELCPELAHEQRRLVGIGPDGEGYSLPLTTNCVHGGEIVVPCLVTPLLTTDEREKLIHD